MHNSKWLPYIPGLNLLPNHVALAAAVSVAIILCAWVATRQLKRATAGGMDRVMVPDATMTYRNFFEIIAESLYGLVVIVMGEKEAPKYFPMIGTLFLFIFVNNLLGLIPGTIPSTESYNTTFALGIFSFLYYNYTGLKEHGIGYIKHFFGPVMWLAPLMLVIEIVSHVFRPLSLGLRLQGNIMGDHVVIGVFSDLVPYLVPVIFLGIGTFVAFIQAFVFCLMTMVYISLSTSHDH